MLSAMVFLSFASGVGPKAHGYTLSVGWKATVRERVSREGRYLGRISRRALEEASHTSRENGGDSTAVVDSPHTVEPVSGVHALYTRGNDRHWDILECGDCVRIICSAR